MDSITFPPKKTFGNLDVAFVEERRVALNEYIQNVYEIFE